MSLDRPFGAPLWWLRFARELGFRPELWSTALRQSMTLARPGWWRRLPPAPTADVAYQAFRVTTAAGEGGAVRPEEVVEYLAWCRSSRGLSR